MSPTIMIAIAVFVGVTAFTFFVSMLFKSNLDTEVDKRLSILTAKGGAGDKDAYVETSLLASSLDGGVGALEKIFDRFFNFSKKFQQADVNLTVPKFFSFCAISGAIGAGIGFFAGLRPFIIPIVAFAMSMLPMIWLSFKRKMRLNKFGAQLPDALELISRALRAGHSLASGLSLVSTEMSDPIAKEFGRVFEEQNLGIPLEEALDTMTERIQNLDLRFFATAIVLQRQTGGDLAEILDKIGRLVRERFKIRGQIQALTGEGRLSGVVLLALPPVLFVVVYRMNPDYMQPLFTDEMGIQMLIGGAISQILGALVIRKIINIRV